MIFIAGLIACSTCFGGTIMPIIRSSRVLYKWLLPVAFGACFSSCRYGMELRHTTLSSTPYRQLENQAPNATGSNHLYNTLELLIMGIVVPETGWASNKICNKNLSVASSWHFISTYNFKTIFSDVLSQFRELLASDDFGFSFMDCCYKHRLFFKTLFVLLFWISYLLKANLLVPKYQVISKLCMSHNRDLTFPILCCMIATKLFRIMLL